MEKTIIEMLKGNMVGARLISNAIFEAQKEIESSLFHEIGKSLKNNGWTLDDDDIWNGLAPGRGDGEKGWGWRLHEESQKGASEFWLRVFIGEGLCQVGIYKQDFVIKKTITDFDKWCRDHRQSLETDGWFVHKWDEYPLDREVSDGESRVIIWNDLFFDRIVTDEHYRGIVINKIIEAIEMLRVELSKFIEASPHFR